MPIPAGPNLVTTRGLALIQARVTELEAAVAAGGDESAKRDLRYWRTRLATAQVTKAMSAEEAGFGSRVTFRLKKKVRTINIVGDDEADPAAGYIAFSAPLARALTGACEGDFVDFGGKTEAIEVLEVSPIEG